MHPSNIYFYNNSSYIQTVWYRYKVEPFFILLNLSIAATEWSTSDLNRITEARSGLRSYQKRRGLYILNAAKYQMRMSPKWLPPSLAPVRFTNTAADHEWIELGQTSTPCWCTREDYRTVWESPTDHRPLRARLGNDGCMESHSCWWTQIDEAAWRIRIVCCAGTAVCQSWWQRLSFHGRH